jgi:hypothetical protein
VAGNPYFIRESVYRSASAGRSKTRFNRFKSPLGHFWRARQARSSDRVDQGFGRAR